MDRIPNKTDNIDPVASTAARRPSWRMAQAVIAACAMLAACGPGEEGKARELVDGFYKMHQAANPAGAFTLKGLISFRPFFSVPLFDLLKDVSVAEEARATQVADEPPPLVRGDMFTANPAGATAYRVLRCQTQEREGNCTVELTQNDAKAGGAAKWTDQVVLTRDARGWIIDNIRFAGGPAPMREGDMQAMLRKLLKQDVPPLQ